MAISLAERSGRVYPHNAIYEILTYGIPYTMRHEPKKYNKRTVNEFWKMLNSTNEKTRKAYELVYANNNTLQEAGSIMKVSPTTIKRYLMNIYFVRDDNGYLIADLERISKSSYSNQEKAKRGHTLERILWFADNILPLTSLSKESALNVLTAVADNISVTGISEFYKYPIDDVQTIVDAYNKYIGV